VSVLRQYLDIINTVGVHPQIIRSDRGVETNLIAAAHYELMRKHFPDTTLEACYRFGTSTANQRIEAWWAQLTKTSLWRWRVSYFKS
jgi:hypothetical protein